MLGVRAGAPREPELDYPIGVNIAGIGLTIPAIVVIAVAVVVVAAPLTFQEGKQLAPDLKTYPRAILRLCFRMIRLGF